ncbi:hypothetical protein B4U80_03646, partial [Leptotrombidium deliense]
VEEFSRVTSTIFENSTHLLRNIEAKTFEVKVIQRRIFSGFGVGNFQALYEAVEFEQQQRGHQ